MSHRDEEVFADLLDEVVPSDRLEPIASVMGTYFRRGITDPKAHSAQFRVDPGTESFVQQQFANEVDINTIVRRFGLTKALPAGVTPGMYGDFTGIHDYQSALELLERVDEGFMRLPAELRDRFQNDPARLVSYVDGLSESELEAAFRPPAPDPVPVPAPAAPVAPPGP